QINDHPELQHVRDPENQGEHDDASQHLHGPRPMDDQQHSIHADADDRDLHEIAPPRMQQSKLFENAHAPPRIAHATSSASRFGLTSWTRNNLAPGSSAATFAPMVPASRSAGDATKVISPMKRFRDTPTSTGHPKAANRSKPRSTASDCAPRFANPTP